MKVLSRCSRFNLAVAPGFFGAQRTYQGHVAQHAGLLARNSRSIDAKRLQQVSQFFGAMSSAGNKSLEFGRREAEIMCDGVEFGGAESTDIGGVAEPVEPVGKLDHEPAADRSRPYRRCHSTLPSGFSGSKYRGEKADPHCSRSNSEALAQTRDDEALR
ncbi:hypothetical protein ACFIOY_17975 [Bradyrhizobium sp. TZ2]